MQGSIMARAPVVAAAALLLVCAGAERAGAQAAGPHWTRIDVPALPAESGGAGSTGFDASRGRIVTCGLANGQIYELAPGGVWVSAGGLCRSPFFEFSKYQSQLEIWRYGQRDPERWYLPLVFNPARGRLFRVSFLGAEELDPAAGVVASTRADLGLSVRTGARNVAVAVDGTGGRIFALGGLEVGTAYLFEADAASFGPWLPQARADRRDVYYDAGALAFDPATGLLIRIGGCSRDIGYGDTYAFDPRSKSWSLFAIGPSGYERFAGAAAYDPNRRRIVYFGGVHPLDSALSDTWELDTSTKTWTKVRSPGAAPPALRGTAFTCDATRGRLVLTGATAQGEVQAWEYGTANRASVDGPESVLGTATVGGRVRSGSSAPLYVTPRGATLADRLSWGTRVEVLDVHQLSGMSTYYLVRATVSGRAVEGWIYGKNVVLD